MGYFNYFIKCIIRNIAYKLCKPKVLLTFLLAAAILFILHSTGYCVEWDQSEIDIVLSRLGGLVTDLKTNNSILYGIEDLTEENKQKLAEIDNELSSISSLLNTINSNTDNVETQLNNIYTRLDSLNNNIISIVSTLSTNNSQLLEQINNNNNEVIEKLDELLNLLTSGETTVLEPSYIINNFLAYPGTFSAFGGSQILVYDLGENYSNYNFTFTMSYSNTSTGPFPCIVFCSNTKYDNSNISNGMNYNYSTYKFKQDTNTSNYILTLTSSNCRYIYATNYNNSVVTMKDHKLKLMSSNSLGGLNNSINQGNQLQQEQNQLQQEQNDFLKDDNVNTEGLEFATDDTVNPTSDGFNTLFNAVYNAFCTTSSEPLTITLPYINETFTIHPNIVSNGMRKAGLGVVVTLISSFYYFSVCLFIYKDISKIIDNLKSGNITSDCGNVKTEVL